MKNFSIKKLASGMTLTEQARLLFDDSALRKRSRGKEYILSPKEEDAILADCREKCEIPMLNRLLKYNKTMGTALVGVLTFTLQLQLSIANFGGLVTGMTFTGQAKDLIESVLYFLSERAPDLLAGISEMHSVKRTLEDKYSIFEKVDGNPDAVKPDLLLQRAFVHALRCYKILKQSVYIVEFLEKEGGMRFVDDFDQKVLDEAAFEMKRFENMEDWLSVMRIYRAFYEKKLMEGVVFEESLFQQFMVTPDLLFPLTKEEKAEAEEIIKWHIQD